MNKIGIGIIGCGDVSQRRVVPGIVKSNGARLVAISNTSAASSERAVQGIQKSLQGRVKNNELTEAQVTDLKYNRYTSAADLLADPEVDAVLVESPPLHHKELTIMAAEAGKHILCDKPMAPTPADCAAMIEACEKANVLLQIGFTFSFHPAFIWLRDAVKERAARIATGQLRFAKSPNMNRGAWGTNSEQLGHPLWDLGSHHFHLLNTCGMGRIKRIATLDTRNRDAMVLAEMDNGVQIDAYYGWSLPGLQHSLEFLGPSDDLYLDANTNRASDGKEQLQFDAMPDITMFAIEHFCACIEGEAPNTWVNGEQGLENIEVLTAAVASARQGCFVDVHYE